MLSIFVPQKCSEEGINSICSMEDNTKDLTIYNQVVVIINYITLFVFIIVLVVEFCREIYCVKFLSININKPWNGLSSEFNKIKEFEIKVFLTNFEYYYNIL